MAAPPLVVESRCGPESQRKAAMPGDGTGCSPICLEALGSQIRVLNQVPLSRRKQVLLRLKKGPRRLLTSEEGNLQEETTTNPSLLPFLLCSQWREPLSGSEPGQAVVCCLGKGWG